MERAASNTTDVQEREEKTPRQEPLEKRYGVIGCAAVKAAALLARRPDTERRSKGFASQCRS